jgi:hypothetical protein
MSTIEKRQNERRMLQLQYAARHYYNRAELLNDLVWLCVIVTWLSLFLPVSSKYEIYLMILPFLLTIKAVILNWRMTVNVSSASSLRKYFDAYVFKLNLDFFSKSEVEKLEELSTRAVKESLENSKIQISNTSRDNPPGVRDWYEFSQSLTEQEAIFECQKQNSWWNKELISKRSKYNLKNAILFAFIFYIIVISKTNFDFLRALFCSGGLIAKMIERFCENKKYYELSKEIEGAIDVLSDCRTIENLKNLQGKIDRRRSMHVLEKNSLHKRFAKRFSELYQDIHSVKE